MDPRITVATYNLWSSAETTTSGIGGSGTIEIEPGFQMIATPVIYGYWSTTEHKHIHDDSTIATVYNYIDQQISDVYGVQTSTMIRFFNTLVGGSPIYYNFVPDLTNPADIHNFQLSYYDAGANSQEVTGYFLESIHPTTFTITWGDI